MIYRFAKLEKKWFHIKSRRGTDFDPLFSNQDICNILKMPRNGLKLGIGEAYEKMIQECYEGVDLVSMDPALQDLVVWAQKSGFYIQPEEDELELLEDSQFMKNSN
jgi:hypothetical protein